MFEFFLDELIGVALWELSEAVAMVVAIANAFTVWLPNHSANRYVQAFYNFMNRLSLNILRNANKHERHVADEVEKLLQERLEREKLAIKEKESRNRKDKRVGGAKP